MKNSLPPNLQSAILHHFIERVESGDLDVIDSLADIGFTPQQIDRLRHLQVTEIVRLIKEDKPLIMVRGNSANLDKALKALSNDRAESALQVEFIRRGASAAMMIPLFRLTGRQVAKLRLTLGAKPTNGRPKLPDEETQIKVYEKWKALKSSNIRQRYLDLDNAFPEIPIAVLYAIVCAEPDSASHK